MAVPFIFTRSRILNRPLTSQGADLVEDKNSYAESLAIASGHGCCGISVVICTFNGAERISMVLAALARSKVSFPAEVILVDNNSTDNVATVAREAWRRGTHPGMSLRVVAEEVQGQAYARRAGVLAARYDVVVFCDDDNLLAEDYLAAAMELMKDQSIGALGGAGIPTFEAEPCPEFYRFVTYFACGAQLRTAGDLGREVVDLGGPSGYCLYGAGLVVRRQDLLRFYDLPYFPLLRGRNKDEMTSHDDYEICHLISLAGKRLLYSRRLSFYHIMPKSRLVPDNIRRQLESGRASKDLVSKYAVLRRAKSLSRRRLALEIIKHIGAFLLGRRNETRSLVVGFGLNASSLLDSNERRILANYGALRRKVAACAVE
jgi:glycosyltransferase involved in cell wall biosynthesis